MKVFQLLLFLAASCAYEAEVASWAEGCSRPELRISGAVIQNCAKGAGKAVCWYRVTNPPRNCDCRETWRRNSCFSEWQKIRAECSCRRPR